MYQKFYQNADPNEVPTANVETTLGDFNTWVSDANSVGGPPAPVSGPALPAATYDEIRITVVRADLDVAGHLVGFVDVAGGGANIVGEGQTLVLKDVDSTSLTFNVAQGAYLIINADNPPA